MTLQRRVLFQAAGLIAALTLASKVMGFVREASLASVFGATHFTDAYVASQTVVGVVFALVGATLNAAFIPVYTKTRQEFGLHAAYDTANSLVNMAALVSASFALAGGVFAQPLVALVAPGFPEPIQALTVQLSRIMFPVALFQVLSALLSAILQSEGNYVVPAVLGLSYNIVVIGVTLLLGPRLGIESVAVGTVVATAIALLLQIPALRRAGYRWKPRVNLRDRALVRILVLSGPILASALVGQVYQMIDRSLASRLTQGSLAALDYANKLVLLVPTILGTAVTTVMFPTLSRLGARADWVRFSQTFGESTRVVNLVFVPAAVGIIVLRVPLVQLVYQRGAFDAQATMSTSWALLFFAVGLVAFTLRDLVSRAFFALQDTRVPMLTGILGMLVNLGLDFLLVQRLRQGGLALATSAAAIVQTAVMFAVLRQRLRETGTSAVGTEDKRIFGSFWRVGIASVVMAAVVWCSYRWLEARISGLGTGAQSARLLGAVASGALTYGVLVVAFRVPEAMAIWRGGQAAILERLMDVRRKCGE